MCGCLPPQSEDFSWPGRCKIAVNHESGGNWKRSCAASHLIDPLFNPSTTPLSDLWHLPDGRNDSSTTLTGPHPHGAGPFERSRTADRGPQDALGFSELQGRLSSHVPGPTDGGGGGEGQVAGSGGWGEATVEGRWGHQERREGAANPQTKAPRGVVREVK